MIHGKKLNDHRQVNKRVEDYLAEYHQAQEQLLLMLTMQQGTIRWQPPPTDQYKLNFDAATFTDWGCLGVGAII